jgi:hypothetical protein
MTVSDHAVLTPALVVRYRLRAMFAVGNLWLRRVLGARSGLELDVDGWRIRLSPLAGRHPDPFGLLRHPALTVAVAESELVAAAISRIAGAGR